MMHFDGFAPSPEEEGEIRLVFMRLRTTARIKAREVRIAPWRFVRMVREMSSGSVLGRRLEGEIPAALTRMSTGVYGILSDTVMMGGRG